MIDLNQVFAIREIYKRAADFWVKPSFKEANRVGDIITYTPSQIATTSRRRAGIYCYEGGYKDGYLDAINDIKSGAIKL